MKRVPASCVWFLLASIASAQDGGKPAEQPTQPPAKQPETKQPEIKPVESKPAETKSPATDDLPSAESLFEKHIAAVGGMEALKAERNRVVRATYSDGMRAAEGQLRVLRVAPNKYYSKLELPGVMTRETWCNAEGAWVRDSNTGSVRLTGEALSESRMQAEFMGESGYKTRYKEVSTIGREKLNGADVFVVLATPAEGKPRRVFFDATTGLIAGIRHPSPAGPEMDPVTTYSDYKKFGDIMHPTRSVTRIGKTEVAVIIFSKIESNLSVMPSVDPPDEIKAIK